MFRMIAMPLAGVLSNKRHKDEREDVSTVGPKQPGPEDARELGCVPGVT